MKSAELNEQALVAPGIANVTLAMVISGNAITVELNQLTPLDKGRLIQRMRDIRQSPIMALDGEVEFDKLPANYASYKTRLEQLVCWLPAGENRTAILEAASLDDLAELASDLLAFRTVCPEFSDACLSLDLDEAECLHRNGYWQGEAGEAARRILPQIRAIKRAFEVQKIAAWAWRMIHAPFDDLLEEARYRRAGYATVAGCLEHLRIRREKIKETMDLYESGKNNVPRYKLRFLRGYGLGWLKAPENEQAIIDAFGPARVAQLKTELAALQLRDLQAQAVLAEIAGRGQPPKGIPHIDYRNKRIDALHCPVSVIAILAMRVANFAEFLSGNDLAISSPPTWVLSPRGKSAEYGNFATLFLLYRGAFLNDELPKRENEQSKADAGVDVLELKNSDNVRACRDIVDNLKKCAREGLFGCGPESTAPVRQFGRKFGWT